MPQPIACMPRIGIRRVLAKFEFVLCNIAIDLLAPDAEQRTHDLQFAPRRVTAHRTEARRTTATQQIEEQRLDLIIRMMREKEPADTARSRDPGKESETRLPGRCL